MTPEPNELYVWLSDRSQLIPNIHKSTVPESTKHRSDQALGWLSEWEKSTRTAHRRENFRRDVKRPEKVTL
ncbi:hypothetical protein B0T14DRAFT_510355, partial [Immersiella caudata]